MSRKHCTGITFDDSDKQHLLYKISPKAIKAFTASAVFQSQSNRDKEKFHLMFKRFESAPSVTVTSLSELTEILGSPQPDVDASDFIRSLPDPLFYAVHDFFEVRNPAAENVNVAHTNSPWVAEIYIEFLHQALKKHLAQNKATDAPVKVGILTASARDPLAAVELFTNTLKSAARMGFPETVFDIQWVPLDKTLATLLHSKQDGIGDCAELEQVRATHLSFNRLEVYPEKVHEQQKVCNNPELLEQQIASLSGLFINGGDQVRIKNTLVHRDGGDTKWLRLIKRKMENNELILGGTSAGAAVQSGGIHHQRPVPMITSGDTPTALFRGTFALPPAPFGCEKANNCPYGLLESDLTYDSKGGLGTFPVGIIDSHFSARDRHGRLALLAASSRTALGFGIDEGTALFADTTQDNLLNMKVSGKGGVVILSMKNGIYKSQAQKHQLVGMSHYLTNGDRMQLSLASGQFEFFMSDTKTPLHQALTQTTQDRGRWRTEINAICGQRSVHCWHEDNIAYLVNPSEETVFYTSANGSSAHCSYVNLLFGIEN